MKKIKIKKVIVAITMIATLILSILSGLKLFPENINNIILIASTTTAFVYYVVVIIPSIRRRKDYWE